MTYLNKNDKTTAYSLNSFDETVLQLLKKKSLTDTVFLNLHSSKFKKPASTL